jgi:tRNA (cytidine32/uridine32-2'-O)-methyltransferase
MTSHRGIADNRRMTDPAFAGAQPSRIRFTLVRTSHPGNIGAAARAIRTMGLERLSLVAPHRFPHADAVAMASGALTVLDEAVIAPTLVDALADCTIALGCTARRRDVQLPELTPREAARRALEASAIGNVAIVFGNERTGLENDELARCSYAVHIPSDEHFPSLNLAQAVQVLAYELRVLVLENGLGAIAPAETKIEPLANIGQVERFFQHLDETLDVIDFHKGRSPVTIMKRLRRMFLRTKLEEREVRILHGILDDAQRMGRLARTKKD